MEIFSKGAQAVYTTATQAVYDKGTQKPYLFGTQGLYDLNTEAKYIPASQGVYNFGTEGKYTTASQDVYYKGTQAVYNTATQAIYEQATQRPYLFASQGLYNIGTEAKYMTATQDVFNKNTQKVYELNTEATYLFCAEGVYDLRLEGKYNLSTENKYDTRDYDLYRKITQGVYNKTTERVYDLGTQDVFNKSISRVISINSVACSYGQKCASDSFNIGVNCQCNDAWSFPTAIVSLILNVLIPFITLFIKDRRDKGLWPFKLKNAAQAGGKAPIGIEMGVGSGLRTVALRESNVMFAYDDVTRVRTSWIDGMDEIDEGKGGKKGAALLAYDHNMSGTIDFAKEIVFTSWVVEKTAIQGNSVSAAIKGDAGSIVQENTTNVVWNGYSAESAANSIEGKSGLYNIHSDNTLGSEKSAITAKTDFEALLQVFDTNGDCKLTAEDTEFGKFVIWKDANNNGVSEVSEVTSLRNIGIKSIDFTENTEMCAKFSKGWKNDEMKSLGINPVKSLEIDVVKGLGINTMKNWGADSASAMTEALASKAVLSGEIDEEKAAVSIASDDTQILNTAKVIWEDGTVTMAYDLLFIHE